MPKAWKYKKQKLFIWSSELSTAITEMKEVIASEKMPAYPDFNEVFEIYINISVSTCHLVADIIQHNCNISFLNRKLFG